MAPHAATEREMLIMIGAAMVFANEHFDEFAKECEFDEDAIEQMREAYKALTMQIVSDAVEISEMDELIKSAIIFMRRH